LLKTKYISSIIEMCDIRVIFYKYEIDEQKGTKIFVNVFHVAKKERKYSFPTCNWKNN